MEQFAEPAAELKRIIMALANPETNNSESIERYNEFLSDPNQAAGAFCFIIESGDVSDQIIIGLNKVIREKAKEIDPGLLDLISSSMIQSFERVENSHQVASFINALCIMYKIKEGDWPDLITLVESTENTHIAIEFATRLIKYPSFFEQCQEFINSVSLAGISSEDPEIAIPSITVITFATSVAEDTDSYSDHINNILRWAQKSVELQEPQFIRVWSEINSFLEAAIVPEEIKVEFAQAAYDAATTFGGSASSLYIAINAVIPIFDSIDSEVIAQFLEVDFEVAKKLLEETEMLPHEALDIYEAAADVYPHSEIYSFFKSKISENPSDGGEFGTFVVAMCIGNEIFEKMPLKFRDDWEFFHGLFAQIIESENTLALTCLCEMIINMKKDFQKQLIENGCFLDITVPLIVSEDKDLAHVAFMATFESLNAVDVPVKDAFTKIWAINGDIDSNHIENYLTLLGKAIEAERDISGSIIQEIVPIISEWFESEDLSVVSGALKLAIMVMVGSDAGYGALIESVKNIIVTSLGGDESSMNIGLFGLNALIKEKPALFVENFEAEIIGSLAESIDNFGIHIKEAIAEILARTTTVFPELASAQTVLSQLIAENITKSNTSSFDNIVLKCLPIACNGIDHSVLSNAIVEICKDIRKFKDKELVKSAFNCLSGIFHNYRGEGAEDLIKSADSLVSDFASGGIIVCGGVPPINDDPDIDLIMDAGSMFSELFNAPSTAAGSVSEFIGALLESGDEDLMDIAISIAAGAAEGVAAPEEIIELCVAVVQQFFVPDIDSLFYQNTCALAVALLGREIGADILHEPISVLKKWWDICEAEGSSMKESSDGIAILTWTLAVKYGMEIQWISVTFSAVPPSDPSETGHMASLIAEGAERFGTDSYALEAIFRLFEIGISKLLKDGVSEEVITILASMYVSNSNEKIQTTHVEKYGGYALQVIEEHAQ